VRPTHVAAPHNDSPRLAKNVPRASEHLRAEFAHERAAIGVALLNKSFMKYPDSLAENALFRMRIAASFGIKKYSSKKDVQLTELRGIP
jgi:hypothetical protein